MTLTPARVAAILTALSGVAAAVAVPVANMDTTSTAGVIAGVTACVLAGLSYLDGQKKHEARQAVPTAASTSQPAPVADLDDGLAHIADDGVGEPAGAEQ